MTSDIERTQEDADEPKTGRKLVGLVAVPAHRVALNQRRKPSKQKQKKSEEFLLQQPIDNHPVNKRRPQ